MSKKNGIIKSCQTHSRDLFQDSEGLTDFIPIVLGRINMGTDGPINRPTN
jgi:hypothetical protein